MPPSAVFSTAWLWNSRHIWIPFPYMSFFRLKSHPPCLHLYTIFLPCLSACPLHLSSALHLQFLTSLEHSRTHNGAPSLWYQGQTPHPDFSHPYNFPLYQQSAKLISYLPHHEFTPPTTQMSSYSFLPLRLLLTISPSWSALSLTTSHPYVFQRAILSILSRWFSTLTQDEILMITGLRAGTSLGST